MCHLLVLTAKCLRGCRELNELEQNALEFLKNAEYEKAAKLYLQLAVANPKNENYLVAAANCYDALGDKKIAFNLYKKALNVNPNSLTALLNISTLCYEFKKYDKAERFARKVLQINEGNFAALMNLGNVHYAKAEYPEALSYYEKLYELNPNSYNAIVNIANTCYNMSHFVRAIEFANMAIEKRPTSVEPYIIAGNSYIELFKNDEASLLLKKAAQIAPNSDWLCNSIANLFQKMGNWKQCLHYAWKAFALKGNRISADDHINFGYLLYEAWDNNQKDLVEKYLARWIEVFPDNPIVAHAASALRDEQNMPTADLTYVKSLFDGFAPSFDDILKELDYQAPQLIANCLKDVFKPKLFLKRQILDLGCGTGLCGQELKVYFPNEEYYGVDVSERMLECAGKKNIYKELYFDDIVSFLGEVDKKYQLIVAGDVLTYFGDLKSLFRSLVAVLKPKGFFCFTISKNTSNNREYFLTPSGRFVHSITYVCRLLKYCGFTVLKQEEHVLRHEGAKDVIGYVILAQKEVEVVFE